MLLIRKAVAGDMQAIVAIVAESPTAPQWGANEFAAIIEPQADLPLRRSGLVAEDDGIMAGFAVYTLLLTVFPPDAELESLAVAPAFRRRGVGGTLLAAVESAAVAVGAESLGLEVRAGNLAALGLYQAAGFHTVGIRKGYYASPREDAVCMQLSLANRGSLPSNGLLA